MKRSLVVIAVLIACGASAGFGYWTGVRQGWDLGIAADSMPRGYTATYLLGVLQAGKPRTVIIALESDVDMGLIWGDEILQHPMRELWRPLWGFEVYPDYEKYVVRMAKYRKEHPSPFKADASDNAPRGSEQQRELNREVAKGLRQNTAKIDAMVERYATKQ